MVFSTGEKAQINKTMKLIYKELKKYRTLVKEDFVVPIFLPYNHKNKYLLSFTDQEISILDEHLTELCTLGTTKMGYLKSTEDKSFESDYIFISNYPENRKLITQKVARLIEKENLKRRAFKENIDHVLQILNNESSLDFDFGDTQAPCEIEISRENGRSVGIIDLGDKTIKIITDGNIILVPRKEAKIAKQKQLGTK